MTAPMNTLVTARAKQEVNDPTASGDGSFTPLNAEVEPIPRGSLGNPADTPSPAGSPAAPFPRGAAGPTTHCTTCNRPRLFGVGWCGTWCSKCLTQWIADGQPAPAETGRTGRTYRLQHDELVNA